MTLPVRCKPLDGGGAHKAVLFQFPPGAFHIDALLGSALIADPITYRRTSFDVRAAPGLKSSYQVPAD
jgi:hypothetical protein